MQNSEQLRANCPKCAKQDVAGKVVFSDPGTSIGIQFECEKCAYKWEAIYELGKLVKTIDMTVPRGGKKQRRTTGKITYLGVFDSRFLVLPDKLCPACKQPLRYQKLPNDAFSVWCAYEPCPNVLANDGAQASTLPGALEKLYDILTKKKGL